MLIAAGRLDHPPPNLLSFLTSNVEHLKTCAENLSTRSPRSEPLVFVDHDSDGLSGMCFYTDWMTYGWPQQDSIHLVKVDSSDPGEDAAEVQQDVPFLVIGVRTVDEVRRWFFQPQWPPS